MKRLSLILIGTALLTVPTLNAQSLDGVGLTVEKVNVDKLKSAITKSDAEIGDVKKNTKAATWVKRGETFLDVDGKPVNALFSGLEESTLKLTFGETATEAVDLAGVQYTCYNYEHFKGYVKGGRLEFYLPTTIIDDKALDKAYDAFAKAYEMDNKTEKKVNAGMNNVRSRSLENANALYNLKSYKEASDNFRMAYKASIHPAVNTTDTMSLFYAGFLGTIAGDYQAALADLNKAIELGYEAEGETRYYKFHCQYNLGDEAGALETLKTAVAIYPNNDSIIEGLLMLYSTGDEDPTNLIPVVLSAIEQNPSKPGLYLGLARVYDKLEQGENAIEAVNKAVELSPDDFFANYFQGLFIVKKGDKANAELYNMTITSLAQSQKAQNDVNSIYAQAVEPLERAYKINPTEIATIELLKNITFRLREDAAMAVKHERYEALFKAQVKE